MHFSIQEEVIMDTELTGIFLFSQDLDFQGDTACVPVAIG
jgi:hypothetical protein